VKPVEVQVHRLTGAVADPKLEPVPRSHVQLRSGVDAIEGEQAGQLLAGHQRWAQLRGEGGAQQTVATAQDGAWGGRGSR